MSKKEELLERVRRHRREGRVALDAKDWGEGVFVRVMSAKERLSFEEFGASLKEEDRQGGLLALGKLLALCMVDEGDQLIFSPDDAASLLEFDTEVLSRAFDTACSVNGIRSRDVEQAAKNSESGPCAASSSSSPEAGSTVTPTSL